MKNKYQKNIVCFFLFLFFISGIFFIPKEIIFAQKELEVQYPEVGGLKPTTVDTFIPEYIKYVFNFVIIFVGIIAIGVLILGGIKYATSTGKPDKLKEAEHQILGAFWGVIILLASYLILATINPKLVVFEFSRLQNIPSTNLPSTPISPFQRTDLLTRIKEMGEKIKQVSEGMKTTAEEIKNLTSKCDCERTIPACLCSGGNESSVCQASRCYAGPSPTETNANLCGGTLKVGDHPCPDWKTIKELQKNLTTWRDEILYYKNRVIAEKEDLIDTIKLLDEKISWYNSKINEEERVLQQLEGQSAKELQQRLIDYLKEQKQWLEEEKGYKNELVQKLTDLAPILEKANNPTTTLSQLPDQCFANVETKCQGSCLTGDQYGCHDSLCGCQPDKCTGGNPCPTSEIEQQLSEINKLPGEIQKVIDQIISIIDGIRRTQERRTQI